MTDHPTPTPHGSTVAVTDDGETMVLCLCHLANADSAVIESASPLPVTDSRDCEECESNWSFGFNNCRCAILAADGTVVV